MHYFALRGPGNAQKGLKGENYLLHLHKCMCKHDGYVHDGTSSLLNDAHVPGHGRASECTYALRTHKRTRARIKKRKEVGEKKTSER